MRSNRKLSAISGLVLLTAFATPATVHAQEDSRPASMTPISIEFAGGSLARFLDQMRRELPGLNIMASALATKVDLPPISIKSASPASILMGVTKLVPLPFQAMVVKQTGFTGNVDLFTVVITEPLKTKGPKRLVPPRQVGCLGTADVLRSAELKVATMLTAVENGLSLSEEAEATIRFHEETKLLFVRGSAQQIMLVRNILDTLVREAAMRRARGGPTPGKKDK